MEEESDRVYRFRVINSKWIAGVMHHGYKRAFELAATVDYQFAYDATIHVAEDFRYEGIARAYLLDDEVREFAQRHNPWAVRDMSDRLLEAHQRGLWPPPNPDILEQIETVMLEAEVDIEKR